MKHAFKVLDAIQQMDTGLKYFKNAPVTAVETLKATVTVKIETNPQR